VFVLCVKCWLSTGFSQSMCTVRTTPKEFENNVFTGKTHQMFSVRTMPEKFENVRITGHFAFVFEENSDRRISWLSWRHRFRKASFSNCFPSTLIRKAGVLKFLGFEERFRKAFVDGRPNWRKKAPFSYSSRVLWTRSESNSRGGLVDNGKFVMVTRSATFFWVLKVPQNVRPVSFKVFPYTCVHLDCPVLIVQH